MNKTKFLFVMFALLTSVNSQALPLPRPCHAEAINKLSDEGQKYCTVKSETISVGNNSTITNKITICDSDSDEIEKSDEKKKDNCLTVEMNNEIVKPNTNYKPCGPFFL